MSMVKLDYGAEVRPLEMYMPRGPHSEYYEVDCPFCGKNQNVQTRRFHQGVRCHNPACRAMLYFPLHNATRDLLPREETIVDRNGLRTRVGLDLSEPGAGLADAFAEGGR